MFPNFPDNNKDEDFLNDFRQKLSDQSMASFEEKRNEINRSKNVFIGAVSGVALAAVVGWFVLSPRYSNNSNAELPVIRRPQTAIKIQPTEPGGMEILNQDKSVYDIIEKKDGSAPVVENLLPPPEEPQAPIIAPQQIAEVNNETIDKIIDEEITSPAVDVTTKAEEIIKIAEAPKVSAAIIPQEEEKLVPLSQVAPTPVETVEVKEVATIEVKEAVQIPVKPEVEVAKAPAKAGKGSWQIQLMSSPNQKALETSWNGMVKKYSVLKDQPHEIETADLGAKGIFYRLQAGAFADRNGADTLCKDIKALGGTCIVKKK